MPPHQLKQGNGEEELFDDVMSESMWDATVISTDREPERKRGGGGGGAGGRRGGGGGRKDEKKCPSNSWLVSLSYTCT